MSTSHTAALEQSEILERISDSNLAEFYRRELGVIAGGRRATGVFNDTVIKNLVRIGILEHEISKGRSLKLTNKGRELLEASK